jgi:signal transduction histidine kinase
MNGKTAGRTVLVVDDSATDRAEIRKLLRRRKAGYEVQEASTGEEGLACALRGGVDCLLLDYYLPDMSGSEVLDRLCSAPGADGVPPLPVVLVTGHESDEVAAEVLACGAQDYLAKTTLSGQSLARAVENAVEKWTIRRALERRTRETEAIRAQLEGKVEELTSATRVKDQFLAVMSHEMRTPLNAILGYTELLDLGVGGELLEGQRAHVHRIRGAGRQMLDLVNDILDISRAAAGHLELDVRAVDLTAIAEETVGMLEVRARQKGIALRLEPCSEQVHARGDFRRLRQVVVNLVGNAIKFTDAGSVTVRCEPAEDGRVRLEVSDTGIGIAPDVLPLVFDEFYQADGELTRLQGGSGLGLAISRRLARLMGGDIRAESEPGAGSVFTLELAAAREHTPLREEDVLRHEATMEQQREDAAAHPEGAPLPVVAFSDRADALEQLAAQVRPAVRLVCTTEEQDVAALARREGARLVVLDIGCCDGAGWYAAHALRDDAELADASILLVPGVPAAAPAGRGALDLGWISVVPKPFTAAQLSRTVASLVGEKSDADGRIRQVLVLDDDPDSRRIARQVLEEAGARVREAADAESALAVMRRLPPDVLVLDLMMPVVDGFGVLAAMRTDPQLARIPVVVLTAKSLTGPEREFLGRSTARVLHKGEHRLADVATLVLRAAGRARP